MVETPHFVVAAVTVLTVVVVVTLHYEAFVRLSDWLNRPRSNEPKTRQRLLMLVLALIVLHVAEIWLFAFASWGLTETVAGAGGIHAPYAISFLDQVYLSAATFTTVGYGDVYPQGPIRFLFGTEALVGFALITWSASLTFLEMQRHWNTPRRP
jgi:hypothetical protein